MPTDTNSLSVLERERTVRRFAYEMEHGLEPGRRQVQFATERLLEDGSVRVRGSVAPAWPGAEMEVGWRSVRRHVALDDDGRFVIDGLPEDCTHVDLVLIADGEPGLALLAVPVPPA